MYADQSRLRIHRKNIRFDQYESNLLQAAADYAGCDVSQVIRNMALRQALDDLDFQPVAAKPKHPVPRSKDTNWVT